MVFEPKESMAYEPNESLARTKGKLAWFYFFSLASMGLCLAILFSCTSGPTSILYIVSVNPSAIYNYTRGVGIPDYYLVGISGACSYTGDQRHCRWGFPQSPDILDLIAPDLNDTNTTDWQILPWGNSDYVMDTQRVLWRQLSQAAGALLVLSIFLTAFTVAYTHFEPHAYPARTIVLDILDAGIVLAAAAMWTSMVVSAGATIFNTFDVVSMVVSDGATMFNTSGAVSIGPGLWVLWSVCLGKLLITPKMVYYLFVKPFVFCFVHCLKNANAAAAAEARRIEQVEGILLSKL